MTSWRDPTANRAVGRASKGTRTPHTYWCVVDGGTGRHGVGGFDCRRCAELGGDDRETDLLVQLDRLVSGKR